MTKTKEQFEAVIKMCGDLFAKKLHDYGASWRVMRPSSVTDQIYIKANRIKSVEMSGENMVGESITGEFIAIVNYSIVGLIQLKKGPSSFHEVEGEEEIMTLYRELAAEALELMLKKNHDYGEAWRSMRVSSYTDLILTKIFRVKQIEELDGKTLVSEGIDANYLDMLNYAVFGLIRLIFENESSNN